MQAVTIQKNPLPMECASAFQGRCTSRDQQLRITTAFQGSQCTAHVGGGFFGTEGHINSPFYTGVRSLTIEHLPTGRLLRMDEHLKDTNGYSAPKPTSATCPSRPGCCCCARPPCGACHKRAASCCQLTTARPAPSHDQAVVRP